MAIFGQIPYLAAMVATLIDGFTSRFLLGILKALSAFDLKGGSAVAFLGSSSLEFELHLGKLHRRRYVGPL